MKKLFSFKGRMRRTTFWIIMLVICAIDAGLTAAIEEASIDAMTYRLILLPTVWAALATWAKRCHDCNYNGWWMFVPFFNFIFLFKGGDAGSNKYGDNPRNRRGADVG